MLMLIMGLEQLKYFQYSFTGSTNMTYIIKDKGAVKLGKKGGTEQGKDLEIKDYRITITNNITQQTKS